MDESFEYCCGCCSLAFINYQRDYIAKKIEEKLKERKTIKIEGESHENSGDRLTRNEEVDI